MWGSRSEMKRPYLSMRGLSAWGSVLALLARASFFSKSAFAAVATEAATQLVSRKIQKRKEHALLHWQVCCGGAVWKNERQCE